MWKVSILPVQSGIELSTWSTRVYDSQDTTVEAVKHQSPSLSTRHYRGGSEAPESITLTKTLPWRQWSTSPSLSTRHYRGGSEAPESITLNKTLPWQQWSTRVHHSQQDTTVAAGKHQCPSLLTRHYRGGSEAPESITLNKTLPWEQWSTRVHHSEQDTTVAAVKAVKHQSLSLSTRHYRGGSEETTMHTQRPSASHTRRWDNSTCAHLLWCDDGVSWEVLMVRGLIGVRLSPVAEGGSMELPSPVLLLES